VSAPPEKARDFPIMSMLYVPLAMILLTEGAGRGGYIRGDMSDQHPERRREITLLPVHTPAHLDQSPGALEVYLPRILPALERFKEQEQQHCREHRLPDDGRAIVVWLLQVLRK